MSAYKETKLHGSLSFPYTVYRVELPEFFNSFPLHWHEEMEIIYVTEGTVQVSVRQSDHVIKQWGYRACPPANHPRYTSVRRKFRAVLQHTLPLLAA